jgi:DNA-binding LytR/AlgR family response regulator
MDKTILLIEDDPDVLRNLEVLLRQEKYNIIKAINGFEGVSLAKENIPDLIVCDILMPKMNGYEVLQALLLDPATNTIPFLFLTAKAEIKDIRKGMGLGADDYLIKPYDIDDLLNAINVRLNKYYKIKGDQLKDLDEKVNNNVQLSKKDRILITINNTPQFFKSKSIIYIVAERQYTNMVIKDGTRILVRRSLSYWEKVLPDNQFLRIHRSTIINLDYISKIEKWFQNSYKVYLVDEFGQFIMSKRFASKLKDRF